MSDSPIVSIIIPAYNVAPYIGEALASVVAQSYTDYEAIVVNDGSTDETERALEPFRDRIIYLKQENRGLAGARNTGLRHARGRYVALLDGDDIWMPDYLEKLVGRLLADPGIDLIYPNAIYFGSPRWEGRLFQDFYPSREPVTFEKLLQRECTVFGSAVFKRELAIEAGMFDESLREGGEDFDLWLRLAQNGARFTFTTEPLVRYRKRSESLSQDGTRMPRSQIRIYEKVLANPKTTRQQAELIAPVIAEMRAQLNRAMGKRLLAAGDYAGAAHHLALANAHFRSLKLTLVVAGLKLAPSLVAAAFARELESERKEL